MQFPRPTTHASPPPISNSRDEEGGEGERGNMQMASNAQSQAVQEDVTELRREIGFLRTEISARNQGAANNSQAAPLPQWAPMSTPPPLAPPQPPQAAYNAIPPL